MEGLEEVKFAGPAVNDQIAGVITGLAKVQSLTIEDAEISAVFLQRLASHAPTARRIHTLAFARCYGVTDEALEPLGEFPSLKTLSLREILVTGAFLVALKNPAHGTVAAANTDRHECFPRRSGGRLPARSRPQPRCASTCVATPD